MLKSSKLVEGRLPCPNPKCGSSDAYHKYDDGHGYCFSCHYYQPKSGASYFLDTSYTYEYLPLRGIEQNTLKFYDVKTKIDGEGKPIEIGFPYPNGSYKVRLLSEKTFRTVGDISKAGLFGRDKFAAGSHKYVTITEGEFDALSLWQVLQSPVVSVRSSVSAARDAALDRSFLNSFERVYLAFDNDARGREAEAAVARLLDPNKVYSVRFSNRKDANEYLQVGEADDLRNIWWNAKKYLPENIASTHLEFEQILSEPMRKGVPYPFRTLTDMTYGIRLGESVLITAQEGVGKTELMHAIEHQLLRETNDPVAAIFLEEPKRRHLQALAGLELKRPVHLPDAGVTPAEAVAALRRVVADDDRLYVYSHFGSDDPDTILDVVRYLVTARGCRYVLLDHITMVVSGLAGEDERRALDYLSTRLEMMVKELDFALILVSHVNDDGKTRGSRNISKIADIRIDVTRDIVNIDPLVRNRMDFVISKNRFSGRTGPAGSAVFDPISHTLQEDLGIDLSIIPDDEPQRTDGLPGTSGDGPSLWQGIEGRHNHHAGISRENGEVRV